MKPLILPPPAEPSDEEPMVAGGRRILTGPTLGAPAAGYHFIFLPAPVTLSDEEPTVAGSRRNFSFRPPPRFSAEARL